MTSSSSRLRRMGDHVRLGLLLGAVVTVGARAEEPAPPAQKPIATRLDEIVRPDHVEVEKAAPETIIAKYPCPPSGVAPAHYAVFGTNSGTLTGYEVASPCTPVPLLRAADAIGMARGKPLGVYNVASIVFSASGLFAPEGRGAPTPATVRVSMAYYVPGARVDVSRAGSKPVREIRVVAAGRAWNEREPGIGELPAGGSAKAREALLHLTPAGALWPLLDAQGAAKVATVNGRTVISAASRQGPIAVTLDEKDRPAHVRLQASDGVYEAEFSGYTEKWEPAYLVPFPAKLVWKRNGQVIADLTTQSFFSNPYVVFPRPLPAKDAKAFAGGAGAPKLTRTTPGAGLAEEVQARGETPRRPDGKPDFSGYWSDEGFGVAALHMPPGGMGTRGPDTFEHDQAVLERSNLWNKPMYRPEHWQTVHDMDFSRVDVDPQFNGYPQGSPRQGPPQKIVQTDKEIVLWNWMDAIRFVPTDGRAHGASDEDQETYNGIGVGRWEGDTLVVESVGFNGSSWLAWPGYVHSNRMKLTERFKRVGDVLYYQYTVDDPDYLLEPWTSEWWVRRLNADPKARPREYPPWEEDRDEMIRSYVDPFFRG